MTKRAYLIWLSGCAFLLVAVAAGGAWALATDRHPLVMQLELAAALPFAAICWIAIRYEDVLDAAAARRAVFVILGAAAAMRLMMLPWPPLSTDIYRYVWDGRVTAQGINPFRYLPADPALRSLRDAAIYPNINRATYAPTIYPPAAQIIFRIVAALRGGVTTMKATMVGFECVTVFALLRILKQRNLPPTRVLIYAWHPLALFEFAGSGHIDAAAIAFMLLACVASDAKRLGSAGALLSIATATKFFPMVVAPALYRRWDWRAPVVAAVVLVALYLPFLGVGLRVFGYLAGYAHEESLDDGSGFFLLGLIDQQMDLPWWATKAYLAAGGAVLVAGAACAVWRRRVDRIDFGSALLLLGAFTLVLSPHLPWYFTWVIPLLCLNPMWSFLYLTCAAPLLFYQAQHPDQSTYSLLLYLPFYLGLIIELALRAVRPKWKQRADVTLAIL